MEPTKKITFESSDIMLEGLLDLGEQNRGVIITHPHPLYGGDMHNLVVESLARAYISQGFSCLRFNFRGVGQSKGLHDEGNAERNDVLAASNYLKSLGKTKMHAAGYSFGAWVLARTRWPDEPPPMVMVAPPAKMLNFDDVDTLLSLDLVVIGTADEFAPPYLIKELVPKWNPDARLVEIRGEDHFFFARTPELESAVIRHLEKKYPMSDNK